MKLQILIILLIVLGGLIFHEDIRQSEYAVAFSIIMALGWPLLFLIRWYFELKKRRKEGKKKLSDEDRDLFKKV